MSPDKAFIEASESLAVQYIADSSLIYTDTTYSPESKFVLIRDQSHKDLSIYIKKTIVRGEKKFTKVIDYGGSEPQEIRRYGPLDIFYTNENYHYHQEPKPSEEEKRESSEEEIGTVGWLEYTLKETRTARINFPPSDPDQRTGILNHLDNDDVISDVLSKVMKPQYFDTQFFEVETGGGDKLIEPKDYAWIYACFDIYRKSPFSSTDLQPIFLSHDATREFLPKTLWNRWCEISTIYWDAVAAKDYLSYDSKKWVKKSKLKEKKIGEKNTHKELYELIKADMSSDKPRSKLPFVRVFGDDSTVMDNAIVEVASFYDKPDLRREYKLKHGSQHFRLLGNALQFSSSPIDFVPIKPENSS